MDMDMPMHSRPAMSTPNGSSQLHICENATYFAWSALMEAGYLSARLQSYWLHAQHTQLCSECMLSVKVAIIRRRYWLGVTADQCHIVTVVVLPRQTFQENQHEGTQLECWFYGLGTDSITATVWDGHILTICAKVYGLSSAYVHDALS